MYVDDFLVALQHSLLVLVTLHRLLSLTICAMEIIKT